MERRPVAIVSSSPFTGPYLQEALRARGHVAELIERPERAGLWLAEQPGAVMLADSALGPRGLNVAIHRARAAGCERIALLRSLKEAQDAGAIARSIAWPVIRKPVSGRHVSLRLDAIGRQGANCSIQNGPVALVADDCPINRLLASRLLEQEGFRTVAVADGIEAVDQVAERLAEGEDPFSLILIDLRMPGLDGLFTARQIRGVEALFLAPPAYIAGLSALADANAVAQGRAEGMDEVVPKPLSPAMLQRLRDNAAQKSVTLLSEMCQKKTAPARLSR